MKAHKARSGPVYVETKRGIISLVFEANVRGESGRNGEAATPKIVGKPDVYVIDSTGVRKIRRSQSAKIGLALAGILCVLLWASYSVFARRKTQ